MTTTVVLRLDELDHVVDTAGDDITLQLTNGARMTGADLCAAPLLRTAM